MLLHHRGSAPRLSEKDPGVGLKAMLSYQHPGPSCAFSPGTAFGSAAASLVTGYGADLW